MKTLKAKKDFTLNGEMYIAGDEVKITDIATIKKLNEKGFIEPLEYKDLVLIERELKKPKTIYKKEEE
jgi:hypothetical protein